MERNTINRPVLYQVDLWNEKQGRISVAQVLFTQHKKNLIQRVICCQIVPNVAHYTVQTENYHGASQAQTQLASLCWTSATELRCSHTRFGRVKFIYTLWLKKKSRCQKLLAGLLACRPFATADELAENVSFSQKKNIALPLTELLLCCLYSLALMLPHTLQSLIFSGCYTLVKNIRNPLHSRRYEQNQKWRNEKKGTSQLFPLLNNLDKRKTRREIINNITQKQ